VYFSFLHTQCKDEQLDVGSGTPDIWDGDDERDVGVRRSEGDVVSNTEDNTQRCWDVCVDRLTEWVRVWHPSRHKIGHFGDILPSRGLSANTAKTKLNSRRESTAKIQADRDVCVGRSQQNDLIVVGTRLFTQLCTRLHLH